MNAKIISIGDEILQGQTLNTNANFLAEKLTDLSFFVEKIVTIPDNANQIISELEQSVGRYNLVVTTGGLGPTSDDRTKEVMAEFFDGQLVENQEVLQDVKNFLSSRNMPLNENNRKQALVPDTAEILRNNNGTAPGLLFRKNSTIVIALPGVPFEMRQLFETQVIPTLKKHLDFPTKCLKIVQTFGLVESVLAEKLSDFEKNKPQAIKMAYLPSPEGIKIKFWAFGGFQRRLCEIIDGLITKLHEIIGEYIYGEGDDTLEKVLAKVLTEKKLSLATAESCTGGHISHKITSVAGSSQYFKGGAVVYSNEAKTKILNVSPVIIEKHGAVSKETVIAMVEGALKNFDVDVAIAVSGIAGPTGGTAEKPVGTTWIAVGNKNNIIANVYKFGTRRDINIRRASATALFNLIKFVQKI